MGTARQRHHKGNLYSHNLYLEKSLEEALLIVDMEQGVSRVDDVVMTGRKVHGQAICNFKGDLHSQSCLSTRKNMPSPAKHCKGCEVRHEALCAFKGYLRPLFCLSIC